MLKIRLSIKGVKKNYIYNINVTDSKNPRDGKFIEKIGHFNPRNKILKIDIQKLIQWKSLGAKLSEKVKFLFKIYKKNLCI